MHHNSTIAELAGYKSYVQRNNTGSFPPLGEDVDDQLVEVRELGCGLFVLIAGIMLMWLLMSGPERCLVRASEMLSLPSIFMTVMHPSATLDCSHNCDVSRCLILPRPILMAIPLAAEASVRRLISKDMPKSSNMPLMPMLTDAALVIP